MAVECKAGSGGIRLMSTSPSDTFTEKISNLLQANWNSVSTGLQVADVFWGAVDLKVSHCKICSYSEACDAAEVLEALIEIEMSVNQASVAGA